MPERNDFFLLKFSSLRHNGLRMEPNRPPGACRQAGVRQVEPLNRQGGPSIVGSSSVEPVYPAIQELLW